MTMVAQQVLDIGYHPGEKVAPDTVAALTEIYLPRAASVLPKADGHPFVNLFCADDVEPRSPLLQLAFSEKVLDVASDYFGGAFVLDSMQVLYSWPTDGALRESQMWHKDYGDGKSFHVIVYLNDVRTPEDGPFVFIDRRDTRRIRRSPIVRRIADQDLLQELGPGLVRYFYGGAGDSVYVDPSACYHYGSRCRHPRLAIFVTFNTRFPFEQPTPEVRDNATNIYRAARVIRPDLSPAFLRGLLRLN